MLRPDPQIYMRMALKLARRGAGRVSPNPMVGAVIVKNGEVVGKGYHRYFGGPHAEVEAIQDAAEKAKGATLFVTLEPCSHFGKTPPCTQAIIKAGIKQVVAATFDPNPLTQGKGFKLLKEAGIDTQVGTLQKEAKKVNAYFFKYIQKKIPYVTVKAAASLDGKIATSTGESKWITTERSRMWGKRLRNKVDAILVGIHTIVKDNPELLPIKNKKRYLRVVLDTHLEIPLAAKILERQSEYPTCIFSGAHASKDKIKALSEKGVRVEIVEEKEGRVSVEGVLRALGKMEIASLLVEGGGEVIASFINQNQVDELFLFLSPSIIGGKDALTWVEGKGFSLLEDAAKVKIESMRRIGQDILIRGQFLSI